MIAKHALRRRQRAIRGGLSAADLELAAARVTERLLGLPEVRSSRGILVYVSIRRELPTAAMRRALAGLCPIAVPRVVGAGLEARRWTSDDELVPDAFGVPTSSADVVPVDVVICPGLAFDRRGARLGYGAGYYDNFLQANHGVTSIGVGVDEALVDEVPCEPHDQLLSILVTPQLTLYTR